MDEPAEDVQPGVPRPDLLPEVAGPVAGRVGRVALAAGVAAIERQEACLQTVESSRHLDQLGIDGEVHERPPAEGDVRRVALGSVLVLGVLDGLMRERVLQLGCRDRDAVDEEAQVEGLRCRRIVRELSRDRQAVGEVALGQFRREAVGGLEVRQADLDAVIVDAVAQDVDRAALVNLLGQSIGELSGAPSGPPWTAISRSHALGCVSAMKANNSATSSPRGRSKSAAHSGLLPHLQTRYPPRSTRLAVIASSKPCSSGFTPRPRRCRAGRSRRQ